jgi:hypothetical protein
MSGNNAYLRELKASNPATETAIQKPSVSQGYSIASLEILKRSRKDMAGQSPLNLHLLQLLLVILPFSVTDHSAWAIAGFVKNAASD